MPTKKRKSKKSSTNKEEIKAWLGLNKGEMLMNIGTIPLILGLYFTQLWLFAPLLLVAFILETVGLYIFLKAPNKRVSKFTFYTNGGIDVFVYVLVVIVIIVKFLFYLSN